VAAAAQASLNGAPIQGGDSMESLVKMITDQVMQAMNGTGGGR
jgi:L-fuculose-phosphate aldolase